MLFRDRQEPHRCCALWRKPVEWYYVFLIDDHAVQQVKVSPKFQVVIPKAVRESLGLRPGQRLQVLSYGDRIELVPVRNIGEMRGFLTDMDPGFEREPDRKL